MAPRRHSACWLLVATLVVLTVEAQLVIRRNTQDCVYPAIEVDHMKLWPTKSYLPTATTVSPIPGGWKVVSSAGFSIEYHGTYKLITNSLAGESYVVFTCGTGRAPASAGATKVFNGPLSSVSVNDGGAADFMAQEVLVDRVAYALDLSVSGCLQALAGCGYLAPDTYNNEDLDKIKTRVDAYITYSATDNPMTIAFSAPAAKTPLERAKWLYYISAFFNKEDAANRLYVKIRDAYNELRRQVKIAAAGSTAPLVCWVYQDYEGDYAMSFAEYKVAYMADAGGVMYDKSILLASGMVPKPAGSTTTLVYKRDTTGVAQLWGGVLQQCDIIIDESYEMATGGITSMSTFLDVHGLTAYADQLPAVTNKQVYTIAGTTGVPVTTPGSFNLGSVGLDWFERGTSRPDEVLKDFVKVITPALTNNALAVWKMRWLLRLDGVQQQQRVAAVCTLPTAKLDSACRRTSYASRICPTVVRNCDTGVDEYPPDAPSRCRAVSKQLKARRVRRKQGLSDCAAEQA